MKKAAFSLLLVASLMLWLGCDKSDPGCDLQPVQILRYDCDRVIFRFLQPNGQGDASWTNIFDGRTYQHVSSASINCTWGQQLSSQPDTIYVKLREVATLVAYPGCAQCQAISSEPPQSKMEITELSLQECGDTP